MAKPTAYTNPILPGHTLDTATLNAFALNHGNAINNGNHDPNDATNGYGGPIPQWGKTNTKYGAYGITASLAAIPADPNETAVSPAGTITMDMGIAVELQRIRGQLARIMGTVQNATITTPVNAGSNVAITFTTPLTGTSVLQPTQLVTIAQGGTSEVVSVASVTTSGGNTTGFVASTVVNSYPTASGTLTATFGGRWNDPVLSGFANLSGSVQTGQLHVTGNITTDSGQLVSSVTQGTAPLAVTSSTTVANLAAQYLGASAGPFTANGPYGAVKSGSGDVGGSASKYAYALPILNGNGFLSPGLVEYDATEALTFDSLTAGTSSLVNSLNRIRYNIDQLIKATGNSGFGVPPSTLVTGLTPQGSSTLSGNVPVQGGTGIVVSVANGELVISTTGTVPAAPGDLTFADLFTDGVLTDLGSTYAPTPSGSAQLNSVAGGSLSGTIYVRYTWEGEAANESLASTEQSIAVGTNAKLQVTIPSAPTGAGVAVSSANVYVGTSSGGETLQGNVPPGGTLTVSSLVAGAALPSSGLGIAQHTGSAYVGGQRAALTGAMLLLSSGIAQGQTNYVDWNGNGGTSAFSVNQSASPAAGYLRLASFTAAGNAITGWTDLRSGPSFQPSGYGGDIGATASRLGFFGATPVARPASTAGSSAVAGASYTSNEQKMLQDCFSALQTLGLLH